MTRWLYWTGLGRANAEDIESGGPDRSQRPGIEEGHGRPDLLRARRIEFLRQPGHSRFRGTYLRAESGRRSAKPRSSPVTAFDRWCALDHWKLPSILTLGSAVAAFTSHYT